MRKIFQNVKQNAASGSVNEKDLRGHVINVSGLLVTIENKIAEGGFSFVFVVRCNKTGRLYALKRQFVNEPRLLEACKREIEITRTLGSHPNIVTYVASSLKPGPDGVHEYLLLTHYYRHSVLQLMNERLATGRYLTIKEIVRIFCDVCCAVARLHHCQTPVVHRDLKVENLLLDSEGVCVLCDFGSATTRKLTPNQSTQPHGSLEEEIARFTTLSYRSPEMVDLYSGYSITTKADIWALGVMLFKLCYFTLPFGESTLAIQSATFHFPAEPQYPPEIQALIVYMLTPDPGKRPDIYQVASVIFAFGGRDCPVKNLHNSEQISLSTLLGILNQHQNKSRGAGDYVTPSVLTSANSSVKSFSASSDVSMGKAGGDAVQSATSVVPRQRPRVQAAASPAALPLGAGDNAALIGPWRLNKKSASPSPAVEDRALSSQSLKENNVSGANASGDGLNKVHEHNADALSLPRSEGANGHRRNISDPSSAVVDSDRCSAFRPYHSQQQVSNDSGGDGRTTAQSTKEQQQQSWNPFDLDDHVFGLHFDELPRRRGSASSIANVKSRESLIMDDPDPFGSAPFNAPAKNRLTVPEKSSTKSLSSGNKAKKSSRYEKLVNSDEQQRDHSQRRRQKRVSTVAEGNVGAQAGTNSYSDHNEKIRSAGPGRPNASFIAEFRRSRDVEVDSVGSASDLQARMQVSSTTDEEASDFDTSARGEKKEGSRRRRDESRSRSECGGDASSYDLDPTADGSPGQAGGPGSGGLYAEPELLGRRPLLAEEEDDQLEPDADDPQQEVLEMNVLSPTSTDTVVPAPGAPISTSSPLGARRRKSTREQLSSFGGGGSASRRTLPNCAIDSSGSDAAGLVSSASDIFLNAPFDGGPEDADDQESSGFKEQDDCASASLSHCQHRQPSSDSLPNRRTSQTGEAPKRAAFVNSSFQGDDAFRS